MKPSDRLLIDSFLQRFRAQKQMAEKAVAQVSDAQLHQALDENTNCLAVMMKHMAGNLRSRFTDFLTTDGEKPDRDRDAEFIDDLADRPAIMANWESGWHALMQAVEALTDADLSGTVTIRGQPHSVADALVRALDHLGYHTGQIVQLSRYLAKDRWQTLTIPRGGSKQFTAGMQQKYRR